jgi:exopolyphosphatase/guanosine-5'-triphosphate,3'-diphosphate pyrophosphatase
MRFFQFLKMPNHLGRGQISSILFLALNKRIAAIDIGTVTTRLLIVDVYGRVDAISATDNRPTIGANTSADNSSRIDSFTAPTIQEIHRAMHITHLGQGMSLGANDGFDDSKPLSSAGMDAVLTVLAEYVQVCQRLGVDYLRCVATSAVRDASNAPQFIEAAAAIGVKVEIISGAEEAQLSFAGATYDCSQSASTVMVVDIGGGSTEFVLGKTTCTAAGRSTKIFQLDSVQMGARRMTDMFITDNPPSTHELDAMRSYLQQVCAGYIDSYKGRFDRLIAVAGTATSLAAVLGAVNPYDGKRIQGYKVSQRDLGRLLQSFEGQSLEQLQQVVGLDPKRAEVIVAGTIIMQTVLDALGCDHYLASDRDLLYGVILSLS